MNTTFHNLRSHSAFHKHFLIFIKDFSLEFFFRQGWHDPNLAYDEQQAGGKKFIVFKVDLVKDIWTPDTYIYGIKSIQKVQTDSAVPASEGLRISPNGEVLFSARYFKRG